MADSLSQTQRSRLMGRVRQRNTKPEILVRKAAHRLGLRFRLHRKGLPGTPDIVFPKYRIALFVHGCFWHRHPGCSKATTPSTRVEFWGEKFRANEARDARNRAELESLGWRVETIWECETSDLVSLERRLVEIFSIR